VERITARLGRCEVKELFWQRALINIRWGMRKQESKARPTFLKELEQRETTLTFDEGFLQ
jgi:hypothetical protein